MSSEISTIEESIKIALDAADAATDITSEYNEIKKKNQKLEAEVKKVYMYTTIIFGSSIFAAVAAILFSSFIYFKSMSDLDVMTTTNREALGAESYKNMSVPQQLDQSMHSQRMKPDILKAFKNNPYTKSLTSVA